MMMKFDNQDVLGGLVNAALLMYALILSPTIIAGGVGTEFFGALMMGENAFFAFSLVGAGIPFATALGIVFWAGVLFFFISISGLRKLISENIQKMYF